MNSGRLDAAAAAALLLAAGGVAALVFLLRPPAAPETFAVVSSEQCIACHADIAAEWSASHHALAYENEEVRRLSGDFANQECIACHAPRPVLAFLPGERVLARQADRRFGVDCLSCHLTPDGAVATANPRPNPDAPCHPRFEGRMASADHCAACHNQHGTVDQWQAAPEPRRGDNCLHCHMQEVWREGGRRGRDHGFPASHDLAALQSAVALRGGWGPDGPWVELENSGAGHNFPTDERSRAADLEVRWLLNGGEWSVWERVRRFRDPYRDETDLTNTQLPAGATWRASPPPAPSANAGEARLLYRTNPYQPEAEAREVARVPLQP
jgi:hypothetical protein